MANYYVRMNLASAIFPFYTDASGRTIIIPQFDENFDRYNAANTAPDKGVPQVFYMHNVMPIAGGFQSIGFNAVIPNVPGETSFDTCYPLLSTVAANSLFVPASGKNYVFDGSIGAWASIDPLPTTNALVSVIYINGVSYIFYAGTGCFTYNTVTKHLDPVTLTGLTIADIEGICEANGYMIAWTKKAIAWSSASDPTNFTPSIQTGAGGGDLQDRKGDINFCIKVPDGFVICCQKNVVGATYTNNFNIPYIFKEARGSGGVAQIEDVAWQGNLSYFPAMTTAGLQQLSIDSAIPTMQEASDFLTAGIFEDFDDATNTFSELNVGAPLAVKFASISNRWIVISYGISATDYTHAIIYDVALNRYGKIKLQHRCAFEYTLPEPYGLITYSMLLHTPISALGRTTYRDLFTAVVADPVPKNTLGFLQQDGTVQLVNFALNDSTTDGTFIIGKFQHARNNMLVHQITEWETIKSAGNFQTLILPTLNGKDWLPAVATTRITAGTSMVADAARVTGKNISIVTKGSFNLTTGILRYTIGGWR